jgi:hypothetical protein
MKVGEADQERSDPHAELIRSANEAIERAGFALNAWLASIAKESCVASEEENNHDSGHSRD